MSSADDIACRQRRNRRSVGKDASDNNGYKRQLLVPYFPEYKLHYLSRNLLEIFDMRLILRMREKGGVTVDFMHARTCV